jgi:tetratricopeptide (TPR) repeat protein
MRVLEDLLESPAAYESRGVRALDRGDWAAAAAFFRKGIALDPSEPSLRHRLGTALFMGGDPQGGLQQFEQVLRESPGFAKAHYSLGVLMETSGRPAEAIERFTLAVKNEPTYVEARLRLASVLGFTGRTRDALAQYDAILEIDPRIADARYGRALTLVRLRRYQEARNAFSDGMKAYANQPFFALALARVLAASPDDRVRDGRGALAILQGLPVEQRAADSGETMAMTLAELGQYGEAAAWQRRARDGAVAAGRNDVAARMVENLRLYESGRPCRTPWREDEMP